MKKIIIGLCVTVLLTSAGAQEISADKVPSMVSSAFKTKFPNVQKVKWEMENEKEYEAGFKLNSIEMSALFDASGNWLETEFEIKVAGLPQPVSQTISKQFNGYAIKEAEK